MKLLIAILFIAIAASSSFAQRAKSALLPSSEAKTLTKQCSRPSPSDFSDTWNPSSEDIVKMESRLANISRLKVKSCCIAGAEIEDPDKWYLQYVGIVQKGKKLIYISAVSTSQPTELSSEMADGKPVFLEVPSESWKAHAIVICDGGNAWGVLYDPATGKFFDLAVNGVG